MQSEFVNCVVGAFLEIIALNYRVEDAREFLSGHNIDVDALAPQLDGKFLSAFVRALKPTAKQSCCATTCCNWA